MQLQLRIQSVILACSVDVLDSEQVDFRFVRDEQLKLLPFVCRRVPS